MHDGALLDFGGLFEAACERLQRWLGKDVAQRDRVSAAQASTQLHRHQGMAAERKEVIVPPDPLDPQQILPDRCQGLLVFALGRFVPGMQVGVRLRRRQGATIELAVGVQRQCVEQHIGARHHVGRQVRNQRVVQHVGAQCFAWRRSYVGHQAFFARAIGARQDHCVLHRVEPGQAHLYLAQFDAKAAQLDLEVAAAGVFEGAIGQPARQVARLVQQSVAGEGVGDEAGGGFLRPVQVAARHAVAARVQLAERAQRQQFPAAAEDVAGGVPDGASDRIRGPDLLHVEGGGEGRVFGGAVAVDEVGRLAARGEHAVDDPLVDRLAADQQRVQAREHARLELGVLVEQ
ncbi:hypothetical protein D3C87_1342680 [compost metagenome]